MLDSFVSSLPIPLPWAILVIIFLYQFGFPFLHLIYRHTLRPSINYNKLGANSGGWAVVTGASDGIGAAFARAFAKKGFNIYLVSRTQSKLDAIAQDIHSKYPNVTTKITTIDFATPDPNSLVELRSTLEQLNISVLVNNVGVNYSFPTPFVEASPALISSIIDVNVSTSVQLTRTVLPGMIERNRGLILNMSSLSGLVPTPLLTPYSGSKSFLRFFSTALSKEVEGANIHVESVTPFFVVTNMSKRRKATIDCPSTDAFAAAALRTIGHDRVSNPWFVHDLMAFFLSFLPDWFILNKNWDMHLDIRRRAIRKQQRLAAAEQSKSSSVK